MKFLLSKTVLATLCPCNFRMTCYAPASLGAFETRHLTLTILASQDFRTGLFPYSGRHARIISQKILYPGNRMVPEKKIPTRSDAGGRPRCSSDVCHNRQGSSRGRAPRALCRGRRRGSRRERGAPPPPHARGRGTHATPRTWRARVKYTMHVQTSYRNRTQYARRCQNPPDCNT